MSNNIARRTLKTTIVLGVFTTIYYCTSLVPAFEAANAAVKTLQLQKDSGDESAQALAFQFLKECTNRKVRVKKQFKRIRRMILVVVSEVAPRRRLHQVHGKDAEGTYGYR
jgi:hypothetical protein